MLYRRTTPLIDNCPLLILARMILNVSLLKSLTPLEAFPRVYLGVINIGISDHSAIYLTRKVTHLRSKKNA